MAELKLSVIVPVHRDADALAPLLAALGNTPGEIIVVASETDAAVEQLCEQHNARYLVLQPCRGAQMDAGAMSSSGDVLWFLHADTKPPQQAAATILDAVATGAAGGYFKFAFAGEPSWAKRLLAGAINLRVALGGTPYGDQGLFVTRRAYSEAGGFSHAPLFEEVALVKALRRLGRLAALQLPLEVDTRRWERDGWLRRSLHNRWLALRFMLGADPALLAQRYGQRATDQSDK